MLSVRNLVWISGSANVLAIRMDDTKTESLLPIQSNKSSNKRRKSRLSKISGGLQDLQRQQQQAIAEEDFLKAHEIKQKINKIKQNFNSSRHKTTAINETTTASTFTRSSASFRSSASPRSSVEDFSLTEQDTSQDLSSSDRSERVSKPSQDFQPSLDQPLTQPLVERPSVDEQETQKRKDSEQETSQRKTSDFEKYISGVHQRDSTAAPQNENIERRNTEDASAVNSATVDESELASMTGTALLDTMPLGADHMTDHIQNIEKAHLVREQDIVYVSKEDDTAYRSFEMKQRTANKVTIGTLIKSCRSTGLQVEQCCCEPYCPDVGNCCCATCCTVDCTQGLWNRFKSHPLSTCGLCCVASLHPTCSFACPCMVTFRGRECWDAWLGRWDHPAEPETHSSLY